MIQTLSKQISRVLVENGANSDDEDVLAYGAQCFLNELLSNALLIMIGLFTHHVAELLIWSISFCLLRINLGGLHAPNHGLCIMLGTLIGSSSLLISPLLEQHALLSLFLTIIAASIAIVIAPVPHKNKIHVQVKRHEIKRKVVLIAILECVSVVGLYFVSPVIASFIASGLIMATVLAVAGLIWNPR